MQTLEQLQKENAIMRDALQGMIDFHHHIGNDDCPYSTNYILVTLYKSAQKALKDADSVTTTPVLNPFDTNGLFEAIGKICQDYNSQTLKNK